MRTLLLTTALAVAAVGASANSTTYQPATQSGDRSGYAETQLDANRVRVSFTGDAGTDRESVEMNLMYRAAETTMQRGFDYFVVVSSSVEAEKDYVPLGPPRPPIAPRRYKEATRYKAVSDIIMHKGTKPADNPSAYDAKTIQTNLSWRIVREDR